MKGSKKRTYDNFKNGTGSTKPKKRRVLKRNDDSDS